MTQVSFERKIQTALKDGGTAIDAVFLPHRGLKNQRPWLLFGRPNSAPINAIDFPQGELPLVRWTGGCLKKACQTAFSTRFEQVLPTNAFSEPLMTHEHVNYRNQHKLLVYIAVAVPNDIVLKSVTSENMFCEPLWHEATNGELPQILSAGMRDEGKYRAHLNAIRQLMARGHEWVVNHTPQPEVEAAQAA